MITKRSGKFWPVRQILDLFIAMGCELRIAEPDTIGPDGEILNFRYLLSPDNKKFVPVMNLDDDELVSEYEVDQWQRVLGISIPKPP